MALAQDLQQLYIAYLGRAADPGGFNYWLTDVAAGNTTLEQVRSNFVNEQPEYSELYGNLSREDTVVTIYRNLFGREPDAGGAEYWIKGGGATVNADQLLVAFLNGSSARDKLVIDNKVTVATAYTAASGDNYSPASAKSTIATVNEHQTSVLAALNSITATFPNADAPGTHTLTAAADFIDLGPSTGSRDIIVIPNAIGSRITDSSRDGKVTINPDTAPGGTLDTIEAFVTGDAATADRIDLTAFGFTGTQRGVLNLTDSVTQYTDLTHIEGFFSSPGGDRAIAYVSEHVQAEQQGINLDGFGSLWVFIDANKDGDFTAANDVLIDLGGVLAVSAIDFIF